MDLLKEWEVDYLRYALDTEPKPSGKCPGGHEWEAWVLTGGSFALIENGEKMIEVFYN